MHRNSNSRDVASLVLEGGGRAGRFGRLLGGYFRADRAGIVAFGVILLLCASFAHAQTGIRWDLGAPGSAGAVSAGTQGGLPSLRAQPGVTLAWCNHPANAVPCTNYATTYTSLSLSSSCPNNSQIVLQGANSCVATGDNFGNLGVYTASNTTCTVTCYDYTLTVNGVSYGPFVWTMGASGGGGGSLPTATAAGQYPNSTAAGTTYTAQSKGWIDVRDQGVDCTGLSDSTTAMQNMINNAPDYSSFFFPEACKVRLTGTPALTLDLRVGLQFIFAGRNGNGCAASNAQAAMLYYAQAYASGNKIFYINRSQSLEFRNMTIWTNGGADTGIDLEQIGATPPITTRNDFYNLCIYNNQTRNSSWQGVAVGQNTLNNTDNQHFYHPDITCSSQSPTSSASNGVGINVWANNPKNTIVDDIRTTNCSVVVENQGASDFSMVNGLGSGWTDFYANGFNNLLMGYRTETAPQAVTLGGTGPHLLMHNDFAASAGTIVQQGGNGCGFLTMINNAQDSNATTTVNCANLGGLVIALNNRNFNMSPTTAQGFVIAPRLAGALSQQGALTDMDTNWFSIPIRFTPSSLAGPFGATASSPGLLFDTLVGSTYDHFVAQAVPQANGNVGLNLNYLGSSIGYIGLGGMVPGLLVGPNSQTAESAITVSPRGSTGATSYTYLVQAITPTGHSDCSAPATVPNANAVLSSTNFNVVLFEAYAGAVTYKIYRTASGGTPGTTGLIGTQIGYTNIGQITGNTNTLTFKDTGQAGDATSCATGNTTGGIQGSTASFSGQVSAQSFVASGANGGVSAAEGDCSAVSPAPGAGVDVLCPNSTAHAWQLNNNNGGYFNVAATVKSGTATMTTAAIGSGACGATVTVAATGVATTDAIAWSYNAAPAANPAQLVVSSWPTANNVNFQYCNPSAGSITPAAATLNWRVGR